VRGRGDFRFLRFVKPNEPAIIQVEEELTLRFLFSLFLQTVHYTTVPFFARFRHHVESSDSHWRGERDRTTNCPSTRRRRLRCRGPCPLSPSLSTGTLSLKILTLGFEQIADIKANEDQLAQVAKEVEQKGRKALALIADVRDEAQVNGIVDSTVKHFGHLDVRVRLCISAVRLNWAYLCFTTRRWSRTQESMSQVELFFKFPELPCFY
jgi:hypothetical protein